MMPAYAGMCCMSPQELSLSVMFKRMLFSKLCCYAQSPMFYPLFCTTYHLYYSHSLFKHQIYCIQHISGFSQQCPLVAGSGILLDRWDHIFSLNNFDGVPWCRVSPLSSVASQNFLKDRFILLKNVEALLVGCSKRWRRSFGLLVGQMCCRSSENKRTRGAPVDPALCVLFVSWAFDKLCLTPAANGICPTVVSEPLSSAHSFFEYHW